MIETFDDHRFDDARDLVEVNDHPLRGTLGLQRSGDRDVEAVRVAVEPRALSGMMRKHVRRLEPELFSNLHGRGVRRFYALAARTLTRGSTSAS